MEGWRAEGSELVDVEELAERIERLADFVSQAIGGFLAIALLSDALGINIFELAKRAITAPWRISWRVVYQYMPLWYALMWILFGLILLDQFIYMRWRRRGEVPPPSYARWISLAMFLISMWLSMVFHYLSLTLICIFSAISFAYTTFVKRG